VARDKFGWDKVDNFPVNSRVDPLVEKCLPHAVSISDAYRKTKWNNMVRQIRKDRQFA